MSKPQEKNFFASNFDMKKKESLDFEMKNLRYVNDFEMKPLQLLRFLKISVISCRILN